MADLSPPLHAVTFGLDRLKVIADHEGTHFWHEPRRRLLLDTIASAGVKSAGPILDVGCGTGALVMALLRQGYEAQGIDPWVRERDLPAELFREGTADRIPWPDRGVASLCAFDLLEHVDEHAVLREFRRVLKPGGSLFVSVPAYRFLWGPRDDRAGHLRRYTRVTLRNALDSAGYKVEQIFGFQFLLLPAIIGSRLLARTRNRLEDVDREDNPPRLINTILRQINLLEVAAGRWRRPPIGSSLIAVARKPLESLTPLLRFSSDPEPGD